MRRREFLCYLGSALALRDAGSGGSGKASPKARILMPDLHAHAEGSLSFLENATDRQGDRLLPYHRITFHEKAGPPCAKPGFLRHAVWDFSENYGRWLYGRIFARRIIGNTSGLEFEETLRREINRGLGADALHYYPRTVPCEQSSSGGAAVLWDNRSIFMGLTQFWALTGDNQLRRQLERTVEALESYSVRGPEPDEAYFAVEEIRPGYRPEPVANPVLSLNTGGWIFPLLDYHRLAGSERALELALRLANFGVHHHNPRQHPFPAGPVLGIWNVHGALFAIAGIAAAAPYSKRGAEHLAWARKLYEHTRDHLASSYGWVAELETPFPGMPPGMKIDAEGCAIVDMVNLSTRLAQQGYPDAWNTVERFARNYMDEGQLCDTRLLEKEVPRSYTPCATNQGMPARARGAFVGHGGPADFFCPEGRSGAAVQNCCGSHYPFGLHLIWEHVVTKEADGLHVNLSFSRDTPWCRVVSQQPYRGIVTVKMREPNNLLLRVPDWVDKRRVALRVGKVRVEPVWNGEYAHLKGLQEGVTVEVEYPLRREKRTERFAGFEVQEEWRGDTVVSVSPQGTLVPLFDRRTLFAD